jgi:shikimate dehydrogenase
VNCLACEGAERVIGHNTDGYGFQSALERAGAPLSGARVLILGSGGAARAAAFTAAKCGARAIALANRTLARAHRLERDLIAGGLAHEAGCGTIPSPGTSSVEVLPLQSAGLTAELAEVVVNATSVGLDSERADPLPEWFHLSAKHTVLDMVYRPLETRLLARARAAGAVAVDGLWMLIHQALEQFQLWTSRAVPTDLAGRLHSELCKEAR